MYRLDMSRGESLNTVIKVCDPNTRDHKHRWLHLGNILGNLDALIQHPICLFLPDQAQEKKGDSVHLLLVTRTLCRSIHMTL